MYNRPRVWVSEAQERLRMKILFTTVIDIERSQVTGKPERLFFIFKENDHGQRAFAVNGSREAKQCRAWRFNNFYIEYATPWKNGDMTTEQLQKAIDKEKTE